MTESQKNEFLEMRKTIILREFSRMNDMQQKAVFHTQGPLLILAGAGSGKTTVIVNRVANLIKFGKGYTSDYIPSDITDEELSQMRSAADGNEYNYDDLKYLLGVNTVRPWEVLAITFTNKAAEELKTRLDNMLGGGGKDITAATFHSACLRILRRFAAEAGYTPHFTIYDTDDSRRLMKQCQKELNIDDKVLPHRSILSAISQAKDELVTPREYAEQAGSDYRLKKISDAFTLYQKKLKEADAMDFDDIIINTVRLFENNLEVLDYCQNRYKYIMVDEYQDTNHAQYVLISLLAEKYRNLCVVGDDNQSIYRFRGATIENILSFEKQYTDAMVVRLEQNYRSTGNILNAANAVIKNNKVRKDKNLWTSIGDGDKIELFTGDDEYSEASYISEKILESKKRGEKFSENAVLYRMNAQSNSVENALTRAGIPYRVIGGQKFYERKEIKDALAYLQVINDPSDSLHLRRIINEPKRGIGNTTIEKAAEISYELSISFFEVISTADQYISLARSAPKLMQFAAMIKSLTEAAPQVTPHELLELALDKSGYLASLQADMKENADRVENVNELSSSIVRFEQEFPECTVGDFLDSVALITDIDSYNTDTDAVALMTMHSAKGLEFRNVYIAGMEEGIFPGSRSIMDGEGEIEEERRLAYVGITRAKRRLYLTCARSRILYGSTNRNRRSRFVDEIPEEYTNTYEKPQPSFSHSSGFSQRTAVSPRKSTASPYNSRNSYTGTATAKSAAPKVTFSVGDTVTHRAFGKGMVLEAKPVSGDTLLTIAFDSVGTKKLMANFAKLVKE